MQKVSELIAEGIRGGTFPGAVLLVARQGEVVYLEQFGNRIMIPRPAPMQKDTIFDVASLTKVLATTLCVMKLVDKGNLSLDQTLADLIPGADLRDKHRLTPRLLLTHSSGLAAHRPFYLRLMEHPAAERKRVLREWILQEPFAYETGRGNVYSDLGFMLLEWVIESRSRTSLPGLAGGIFYEPLGLKSTFFKGSEEPPLTSPERERFAATEHCPLRKRVLLGEVDDENAFALGGYSGHAGLFSTAEEAWALVHLLRDHYRGERSDFFAPATIREFFRRQEVVEGSDWALGWDTRAITGSSSGNHFSRNSVGHTGFTGTSIWMDLDRDVAVLFFTNRVHPSRENTEIFKAFRPRLHDAVMESLGIALHKDPEEF